MRVIALLFVLVLLCSLGTFSPAKADTILFPVIAVNQPNVTTIISVWTRPGTSTGYLHYIYRTKCAIVGCGVSGTPNYSGSCASQGFTRNSFDSDLVSFDASGVLNGGNALFNDPNTYNGTFDMGGSGARRAYLLVTHSDASGTPVTVGEPLSIGGEAMIMDIATGAAWGYRGVNDYSTENYNFNYIGDGGGVTNALSFFFRWFQFLPPNEWTTKFFITRLGNNMDTANISATVSLNRSGGRGAYNRGGSLYTFSTQVDLQCTAAVNLTDLLDSTTLAAMQNTGGWAWFSNESYASGSILVYKLEYVVNNPTYGGTNNNGYLLSSEDY